MAQTFKAQDEAHARALAFRDEQLAARDAELADLRIQIATAQASLAPDTRDYDEAGAREFIDLLLHEAGWALDQARDREYPVTGMPNAGGSGFADYVLWGANGLPLAVVEAKRTAKSPQVDQQQAKLYADGLEQQFGRRPVIFFSNGYEHWLWDDAGGYPPREIQGFFTRDDLEPLIQRRSTRTQLYEHTRLSVCRRHPKRPPDSQPQARESPDSRNPAPELAKRDQSSKSGTVKRARRPRARGRGNDII